MKKIILSSIFSFIFILPVKADIQIGVSGPFSGSAASYGEQIKTGTDAAVKDINAHGGILGQPVKAVYEDDACDPKQGVSAANRLVGKDVALVTGLVCSSAAMPATEVYNEEGMPTLFMGSNPQLTERGFKSIFRVNGRDDQQTKILASLINSKFKDKKIALIHDKQTWGKGLIESLEKDLAGYKIKPAFSDSITAGEKDFSALISKLRKTGVDVVVIGLFPVDAGAIVRQSKDQKYNPTFIGGDSLSTTEFNNVAGPAGEGVIFSGPLDPRKIPSNQKIVKSIAASGGKTELYTLYSYASMQIAADALNKAGAVDAAKIKAVLNSNKFNTVIGDVKFDSKGDISLPVWNMYYWTKGDYQPLNGNM